MQLYLFLLVLPDDVGDLAVEITLVKEGMVKGLLKKGLGGSVKAVLKQQ